MHWFEGSIAEAVAQSKSLNAVFIVFIEGPDDLSRELSSMLESPAVSSRLEDKSRFLSVKLSSTSPNYTHFAQIYKLVPVPSVFFIGRDGAPLEVVVAGITPDKLQERIDNILKEYYKTAPSSAGPSTSSSQDLIRSESQQPAKPVPTASGSVKDATREMNNEEQKSEEKNSDEGPPAKQRRSSAEFEVVCDGDVCVRRPTQETVTSQEPSTEQMVTEAGPPEQPSLDSRLERAKEILDAKKLEKEAKEKELEKQKEIERRAMGQGVAELRKWQADQDLKEAAEERRRERMENNLARQRILEQIAQDRAERRARDTPAAVSTTTTEPTPQTTRADANQVRIQLKLLDGSSHVATFRPDDTISAVHEYVATQGLVPPGTNYTLWTAFPRRELPRGTETLLSLCLAPSAALLVLPESGAAAPQSALPAPFVGVYAIIVTLLTSLVLQPAQSVWAWLRVRLFPATPGGTPIRPPSPAPSPPTQQPAPGLRYRAGSNIHRLREERSSDDENNTWNGNSTQQM